MADFVWLVIFYSINVFITFFLSQLGMSKHWWSVRHESDQKWKRSLLVSGSGLLLTAVILVLPIRV